MRKKGEREGPNTEDVDNTQEKDEQEKKKRREKKGGGRRTKDRVGVANEAMETKEKGWGEGGIG